MTTKSKREELFNLADNVVDAILNMSDEEIQADLKEEGISAEDAGKAFDSLLDSARLKAGRKALAKARKAMEEDQKTQRRRQVVSAEEARAIIARAALEHPQMTQAARNAKSGDMSDSEVFDLLDDLLELGVDIPGGGDP